MSELFIYNRKIESFFQLLGEKENNISYSVAYTFSQCPHFLNNFLNAIGIKIKSNIENVVIRLQEFDHGKGFTDFEVYLENEFYLIIEAKRGWNFPSFDQLSKYKNRATFLNSTAPVKKIIVFNESTLAFTNAHFGINCIDDISVEVVSWKELQTLIKPSIKIGRDRENRILKDLSFYLEKISTMQKTDSNWVYVVSLGAGNPDGWSISWQDIVNKNKKYFHPVGGKGRSGWPSEPPNYIAFRYNGKLQSIHHIDRYEVFTNPKSHFSSAPKDDWKPHYLYHLGTPIKPAHEIRTGKRITRNNRVSAMIDLLLTSNTIQEAWEKSKLRQ